MIFEHVNLEIAEKYYKNNTEILNEVDDIDK